MFSIFTSIVMVIGILTVYYTSPKPPGIFFVYYIVDNEGTEKSNKIVSFQLLEVFWRKYFITMRIWYLIKSSFSNNNMKSIRILSSVEIAFKRNSSSVKIENSVRLAEIFRIFNSQLIYLRVFEFSNYDLIHSSNLRIFEFSLRCVNGGGPRFLFQQKTLNIPTHPHPHPHPPTSVLKKCV